jgi:uncharacterized protein YecT (DUF1311 family)
MKTKLLFRLGRVWVWVVLVLLSFQSFGQIDFKNPPWNIGCDTMQSQLEMNVCSLESFNIADSILTEKYASLIIHLDSIIHSEQNKAGSSKDKMNFVYLEQLKSQRSSVIASQKAFIKFRDSFTSIIEYEYSGGSMQPLAVNNYALKLTVNQLEILTEITDEITHK